MEERTAEQVVKEKWPDAFEWQEMMERLKKLEKQIRGEGGPTF